MRLILILLLWVGFTFATNYHIGSGQTYTSIAGFTGWTSLAAGDTVFIHPGTYRENILLCQSGTSGNPIVLQGVLDVDGSRPIISGDSSVTPTQYAGHLYSTTYQGYGLIYINRSVSDDSYGVQPQWIEVRNLRVTGANPEDHVFRNTSGSWQAYPNGSSGIYVKVGSNILIENCEIDLNGNGFDVQGVDAMCRDITVRSCHIHNNGRTDARLDREHNVYTEVSTMIFEFNLIGRMRSGAGGSAIKSRGADTIIRYNWIYSGARCLDLVEPENQGGSSDCEGPIVTDGMRAEPGYDSTWVYGNVFINGPSGTTLTSGNMFHYGADNCPAVSRSGTLFFYNNTVYTNLDDSHHYYYRLFDLTSSRETLNLRNNVFYNAGDGNAYFVYSSSYSGTGTINWNGGNWITSGYGDVYTGDTAEAWNENTAPTEGSNSGIFTNASSFDFTLPVGSPLIDNGVALAAGVLSLHPVNKEYVDSLTYQVRSNIDDIGALAYAGADETAPTLSSVTVPAAGTTVIMDFNETVTESGNGSNWSMTLSGGSVTLSSPNVDDDAITYTASRTIMSGETLTELDYTQPGNGIEDVADNDLASINNFSGSFTNNSTQEESPVAAGSGVMTSGGQGAITAGGQGEMK